MQLTRKIHVDYVPEVLALVSKFNQRAEKIGALPMTVSVGPVEHEPAYHHGLRTDGTIPRVVVEITGEIVKLDGYRFLGRVDYENGHVLINARPGSTMPKLYRERVTSCSHCNVNRKRTRLFIFERESGEVIHVGSSCLADFMGHDPEKVLFCVREWMTVIEQMDDYERNGFSSARRVYYFADVLACASYAIKKFGFVSRRMLDDDPTQTVTGHFVFLMLTDRETRRDHKPSDDDHAVARACIAWMRSTFVGELNDYQHNAMALLAMDTIEERRINLATSLIAVYNRQLTEKVEAEKKVNEWIGTVKKREQFAGTYAGCHSFETDFGYLHIARFETPAGLLVYKGGTPFWDESIKIGDTVQFVGTVKEHSEYKGRKQTIVQRCKLIVKETA